MTQDESAQSLLEVELERLGSSIGWSPDGSRLAVGDILGGIRVFTSEGRALKGVTQHTGRVASVTWSGDGSWVATASWDNTLRVWDGQFENEIFVIESEHDFNKVDLSPDGEFLVGVSDDCNVWIVDARTGQVHGRYSESDPRVIRAVAWSPDRSVLATGSVSQSVQIWEALTGVPLRTFEEHPAEVMALAWSPDGRLIASVDDNGNLLIWAAATGRVLWSKKADRDSSFDYSVSWSPCGGVVATIGGGPVRFWDARSGESLRVALSSCCAGAFSPEGQRFAVVEDFAFRILDVSDLVLPKTPTAVEGESVADWVERQATTVGRRAPEKADVRRMGVPRLGRTRAQLSGEVRAVRTLEELEPNSVDLHPAVRNQAVVAHADEIRFVDLERGSDRTFEPGLGRITSVAWSPDGRCLAAGSNDATSVVVDPKTDSVVASFSGEGGEVNAVAWSPDGRRIASGSDDSVVAIWRSRDGELVGSYRHGDWVLDVAWSRDGRYLASGGADRSARCWEASSGAEVSRYEHSDWVRCVRFSPDGRFIASGSDDHKVVVWELATGRPYWSTKAGTRHSVYAVAWSASGRFLAVLTGDGSVSIGQVGVTDELELLAEVEDSTMDWPGGLVWSHDGSFLAATQGQGLVFLDVSDFVDESHRPRPSSVRVPGRMASDLAPLPGTLAALHRLGLAAPLSLVRDLRTLLSGGSVESSLGSLAQDRGVGRLRSLRWRGGALAGLVALLLREARFDDWIPPRDVDSRELTQRLTEALSGEPVEPLAPEIPVTPIRQAAEAVDDRLMTLLVTLGPDAVAADPGVVLRLLRHVPDLPKLAEPQRRLLSLRVAPLEPGPAQGSGIGVDRTGISPSGPLTALLPSQLAYPKDLFVWRYRNRELLYRARTGREPPRLRPAVLVLDVSPASFGPIEGMTRPAAFVLASTLRHSGMPAVLIAAGGKERVHLLEQPADLVRLFTLRSQERADSQSTMAVAERMRSSLRDGAVEPVVVLLTQPWWGEGHASRFSSYVRGLFVQYPGRSVRPAWADVCERWETIDSRDHDRLPQALGRLIA